jgi:four helix bundle protein
MEVKVMAGFKDLKVWRRAKELAVDIYKETQDGPFSRDFGFRDQIRKAAVSIPSNIAEGDERGSNKDAIRFFYIAKGSLAELRTQVEIAFEVGYLNSEKAKGLDKKCVATGKMLGSLIKARYDR